MYKTTAMLVEEHHIILKALDCLEKLAEEAQTQKKLVKNKAESLLDFIRNFADHCHHGKEEDILFGIMEDSGIPREGGPIGCMLSEHEMGRNLVKAMSSALENATQGDDVALKTFCEAADHFILLLRGHITKENNVLFMLAEQAIPEPQKQKIQEAFALFNQQHQSCYRRYFAMIKELCEHYQIPFYQASEFKVITVV